MRKLIHLIAALLLSASAIPAQEFSGLASNYDGSILYFASRARQSGTTQSFHSKIYRWDSAAGVRVIMGQPDTGENESCTMSNFYNLIAPQVSSDRATFAYTGTRPVTGPSRFCSPAAPKSGPAWPETPGMR